MSRTIALPRFRRAYSDPGSVRWFRGHEEFFAFYWRQRFRWLPEIHTTSMESDGDDARHILFVRWLCLSLNVNLCTSTKGDPCDGPSYSWGWQFIDDMAILLFGSRRVVFDIPFLRAYHCETQILHPKTRAIVWAEGGRSFSSSYNERLASAKAHSESYPYRYALKNGKTQEVIATVHVQRMIWRRKWTPLKIVRTYIDVEFSDEVGERANSSWKGGCIACSYPLLPSETVEECLRRMESERKFT
jgi:hypothetical protein